MQMATQLGGGVEIVGPAQHRGFPEVTLSSNASSRVQLMIESPKGQGLIEQVKLLSSEYPGLIPDCATFARSISKYRRLAFLIRNPERICHYEQVRSMVVSAP